MQLASLLFVTSMLAAPDVAPPPPGTAAGVPSLEAAAPVVTAQGRPSSSAASRRKSRRFGLGANVGASTRHVGGNFRYWFTDQLGVQLSASWYRPGNAGGSEQTSTALIAPSVVYVFTPFEAANDVNLRPYAGGGINYARSSVPVNTPLQQARDSRGTGGQVFGGVELTFKDAEQISISGEVVHYWVPGQFLNADAVRGTRLVGSIFFYF